MSDDHATRRNRLGNQLSHWSSPPYTAAHNELHGSEQFARWRASIRSLPRLAGQLHRYRASNRRRV